MRETIFKNGFKRIVFVVVTIVIGMSLFACKSKSNGDKLEQNVNTNETKAIDNSQQIPSQYAEDTSIAERTTWKKVYHEWPEPPEEQKIYTSLEKGKSYYLIPYSYKGKEYWISCDNNDGKRIIYNKNTNDYKDIERKDRAMVVGADKTEEVWQLLEILEAGDNMVKGVTKGKVQQHTKLGLD